MRFLHLEKLQASSDAVSGTFLTVSSRPFLHTPMSLACPFSLLFSIFWIALHFELRALFAR
jgi:hypothetical protein